MQTAVAFGCTPGLNRDNNETGKERHNQALKEEWNSESIEKQMLSSKIAGFFSEECCKTNSGNHA
jgi:hypothetical protein